MARSPRCWPRSGRQPRSLGIGLGLALALLVGASSTPLLAQGFPPYPWSLPAPWVNVPELARQTTVRILTDSASGSGVLIQRQGPIYTVLTSWHVLAFSDSHSDPYGNRATLLTPDGRRYGLVRSPRQLGNTDLAIVQFHSTLPYRLAPLKPDPPRLGEPVYAAGFPMYHDRSLVTTFDQGIHNLRLSQGIISLLPTKSLPQGYRLGYSNDVVVGMSGGPIFNSQGLVVGINGRIKDRDPGFGVYAFEDGSEPDPVLLEQMLNASWGIPITTYFQFVPYMSRR